MTLDPTELPGQGPGVLTPVLSLPSVPCSGKGVAGVVRVLFQERGEPARRPQHADGVWGRVGGTECGVLGVALLSKG